MRKRFVLALLLVLVALYQLPVRSQTPPVVRIGLTHNASTVMIRAASAFTSQQRRTRSATFSMVLAVDPAVTGTVTSASLQYRTLLEMDGGKLVVMPKNAKTQIDAGNIPLEF